jgi:hypothetical protein
MAYGEKIDPNAAFAARSACRNPEWGQAWITGKSNCEIVGKYL